MAARTGSRKARRFAQAVPGTPTRPGCRPDWRRDGSSSSAPLTKANMAKHPTPGAPAPTPDQLRNAVEFMDSLSQNGFSEISAIAKLALAWLETPDGHRHLDVIAHALSTIWGKADDIQNCINSQAEEVGCHYVDDAERRRWDAQRAARELEHSHA